MPPPAEGFAARFVLGPALRTQPDRRLIALVREGYENAFEEIVRRYGRSLNRYAAAIVGGRAEDVTQDAFSKALLALRRDGNEIELRPWLFRIVRNTALNELRDRPPSPELLAEAIAGGSSPAEEMERREELSDLMKRLQALPEPQRAAIVMREMEGLSHEEIAAALGVSGGAARQAIHRARQGLRNGAGMLVPLPLLKALLVGGAMGGGEVAAGAAGAGGAASAGVALKAAAATVLVAGAVGAGVAVHDSRHSGHSREPANASSNTTTRSAFAAPVAAVAEDRSSSGGESRGRGESELGDNHGGKGSGRGGDRGGRGAEPGDNNGGHGGGSGPSGGPGGGGSDDFTAEQETSSGSGPGSGGEEQPPPPQEESSGSEPSDGSGSGGGEGLFDG